MLGKWVLATQHAFVKSRQILDAILITSGVIDSRLKSFESGIICKLDVKKVWKIEIGKDVILNRELGNPVIKGILL